MKNVCAIQILWSGLQECLQACNYIWDKISLFQLVEGIIIFISKPYEDICVHFKGSFLYCE